MVQHSMMNDEQFEQYSVLVIAGPRTQRNREGELLKTPMGQHDVGLKRHRSRARVGKLIRPYNCGTPDHDRHYLVVSVYVEGKNSRALANSTSTLHARSQQPRNGIRTRTYVILVGGFN